MVKPGRLIIVCGLPGSGKTTIAIKLQQEHRAFRLSADEWMSALAVNLHDEAFRAKTEALQWTFGKQLLAHGQTVIVEWGTWGRHERDLLREEARSLGASVELHYLSAPAEVLFERIRLRNMEDPPITCESVHAWEALIEAPSQEEFALFDEARVTQS